MWYFAGCFRKLHDSNRFFLCKRWKWKSDVLAFRYVSLSSNNQRNVQGSGGG